MRFRSRYAAVLKEPEAKWSGKRRIAMGFRGDRSRLKPPRVLAVLPLTQAPRDPKIPADTADGTPFLIVLDESWFRECGIGERLQARIAREKPEIPEGENDLPTQLRFGPLPDHHLAPIKVRDLDEPPTCFGTSGLSLDHGGSQALANATAFVVYPPAGTPPHFNLFVAFSRVLDLPTDGPASEPSEAFPLYTLADSAALAFGREGVPLPLTATADDFTLAGGLQLAPFKGAEAQVMGQYRYLMIVGQYVRDGGRGVDVFLPEDVLWIAHEGADTARARWIGAPAAGSFTAALVAEVLLNGRFAPQQAHPLSGPQTLRQLLLKLLNDPKSEAPKVFPDDAPGMIRRVSPWFRITTS